MKAKNYWFLSAFVAIFFILIALIRFYLQLPKPTALPSGPGMMLPFEKVTNLNRAIIVAYKVSGGNISGEKPGSLGLFQLTDFTYGLSYPVLTIEMELPLHYWDGFIAVTPDNSKFYIGAYKHLVEFDNNLSIQRKIPISEFEFEPRENKFEFGEFAKASNDRLWFQVYKSSYSKEPKIYTTFLVEWCTTEPPSARIVADIGCCEIGGITVNNNKVRVFPFGILVPEEKFYPQTPEALYYPNFDFIDFDENWGLLLSKSVLNEYSGKPVIIRIYPDDGEEEVITEGFSAVWGFDGYIYFSDGNLELWRCKSDGSERQPVYIAKGGSRLTNKRYSPPKVSSDRTLLAFGYNYSIFEQGAVFIDLKDKEYIEIVAVDGAGQRAYSTYDDMAWLTKNSSEVEPLRIDKKDVNSENNQKH